MENCRVCEIIKLAKTRRYPLCAAVTTANVIVLSWPTEAIGTVLVLAKRHAATTDDALMRHCLERDTDMVRQAIMNSFHPKHVTVERTAGALHGHAHLIPVYPRAETSGTEQPECCRVDIPLARQLHDKQRIYDALTVLRVQLAKEAFACHRSDFRLDMLQESNFPPPFVP